MSGYNFSTYAKKETGEACLQIIYRGRIIFRRTNDNDGAFTLGQPENTDEESKVPAIANGTDITGRGRPDMIVSQTTGGAHCCLIHYVFELAPKFKLLATLNAEDTWPAYFADLDGQHHYEYLADDWAFAYWPGSFAGSPVHSVILQFTNDGNGNGAYHLDLAKMSRAAPTPAEWEKDLQQVRSEQYSQDHNMANALPSILWQKVLDLIYTGHSDLAWKFLDEVGPGAQAGDLPDLSDFCSLLRESQYWPDLQKTLQNAPPACIASKAPKERLRVKL